MTVPHLRELLADAPSNWGRWGDQDELGALNLVDASCVLAAVATVSTGRVVTLQVPIGRVGGDVSWPGRQQAQHRMTLDRSDYAAGKASAAPGGLEAADDTLMLALQGTTHTDALGHVWYDEQLWNAYPAASTEGGLDRASALPLAERGVVGRGVLLDLAAARGVSSLQTGDTVHLPELLSCAQQQGVTVGRGDVLVLRTGWLADCLEREDVDVSGRLPEPGLTYSPELVQWFHETAVAHLVTDTLANEATIEPTSGVALPLHAALMRNLGVGMTEVAWLEQLAQTCAELRRWEFLYVAAALKIARSTGSPVNPVAIF